MIYFGLVSYSSPLNVNHKSMQVIQWRLGRVEHVSVNLWFPIRLMLQIIGLEKISISLYQFDDPKSETSRQVSSILVVCTFTSFYRRAVQWRNRRAPGGGGRVPQRILTEKFLLADLPGKNSQGKKGRAVKIEKKRRKIVKGKMEDLKMEGWKSYKMGRGPFFFFLFFFLFTFQKYFVLGLPKWKFSTGKK